MKKIPYTKYKIQNTFSALAIFITLLTLLHNSSIVTRNSYAQEATESGLLQKLNELKNEIASKAAQIKNEVNKKVQNKAFLGRITNISDSEITLQTLNSTKTIKHDEFTEVLGAKGKKIEIDTLEVDDQIAALGDVDDKSNLVAQRLIFLENFASNSAQLVWGQIQKSSGSTITLKTTSGQTENIMTNSQTQLFLGNEEATTADAKAEKHLVVRGTRLKDGSLRAKFIYFIPSTGFTKPTEKTQTKTASPSAKVVSDY